MASVQRFEDLIAWQKARVLARNIYQASRTGEFGRDFGLARQMQRAAVSVMSNVAEGFERCRPGEFHHYVSTAKGSCAELRSQLYVALDIGYLDQPGFDSLMRHAEEVERLVGGLRASVERTRDGGKDSRHE